MQIYLEVGFCDIFKNIKSNMDHYYENYEKGLIQQFYMLN